VVGISACSETMMRGSAALSANLPVSGAAVNRSYALLVPDVEPKGNSAEGSVLQATTELLECH
jgi:hypothetical protein